MKMNRVQFLYCRNIYRLLLNLSLQCSFPWYKEFLHLMFFRSLCNAFQLPLLYGQTGLPFSHLLSKYFIFLMMYYLGRYYFTAILIFSLEYLLVSMDIFGHFWFVLVTFFFFNSNNFVGLAVSYAVTHAVFKSMTIFLSSRGRLGLEVCFIIPWIIEFFLRIIYLIYSLRLFSFFSCLV